jgi:hypothetical protein
LPSAFPLRALLLLRYGGMLPFSLQHFKPRNRPAFAACSAHHRRCAMNKIGKNT